jgi:hypothetical protein
MTKHKEKLIDRSLKASKYNYKENREMFIGLLK